MHVFPRVAWRSHMCASQSMVWVSLRFSRPLYSFERPPVAGPSTATLGSPHKPAGYVFVVFLDVVDRTRRSRARTHNAVIWRARENGSRTQIGTKLTRVLRFVSRRYDTEIKGCARERRAAVRTVVAQMACLEDH